MLGYIILIISISAIHWVSLPIKSHLISQGFSQNKASVESVLIAGFLCLLLGFGFIIFLNSME